eukprot:1534363-Ditylum_brightwellii.AAC.1
MHYQIPIDWEGSSYCGLTFEWNYNLGYVDVSMPGYILKALEKFQHPVPKFPQHCPHQWNRPVYYMKVQYATAHDNLSSLDAKGTKRIQSIMGTFLYYSRALEGPALLALNDIGTQQSTPTKLTINDANWMMDFSTPIQTTNFTFCL